MSHAMIYWIATGLVSAMGLWSGLSYIFDPGAIKGFAEMGFPPFFRYQLTVLNILSALILIIPGIPVQIKEWAYAGMGFFFITALVAHVAHKDPMVYNVILVVMMGLLAVSNIYLHKLQGS